jgi:CRP-like cAMP-binding protein
MYPNLIKHIRQFIEMDNEQQIILEPYIKTIKLKKKDLLLNHRQICRSLFFVEKGCLRMYFVNAKGFEQTTQFAIEKWWISDYMSFINYSPSDYYIQAIEHSEIQFIVKSDLEKLLIEIPSLNHYFHIIMQKNLAASQQRIKLLYEMSKEELYFHFVKSFPEFSQRIPQFMIASYLGLTAEYVSELRKKQK